MPITTSTVRVKPYFDFACFFVVFLVVDDINFLVRCQSLEVIFLSVIFSFIVFILTSGKIVDVSVSADGMLLCTTADDKSLKVFDVINFGENASIN